MQSDRAPITNKGLTQSQRSFIKSSIEHFFYDLPQDENSLIAIAKEFHRAFFKKLEKSSPLFDFQNCIHDPTVYLRLVDIHNSHITIGQVQRYLFNLTKRTLRKTAKKRDIKFGKLDWNTDPLHTLIQNKNFKEPFKSGKSFGFNSDTMNGGLIDSELKLPNGVIYQAKILPPAPPNNEFEVYVKWMQLQVDVVLEDGNPPYVSSETLKKFKKLPYLRTDEEDAKFYRDITPDALKKAENIASDIIIDFLRLDTQDDISPGCRTILTHQYYYNAVYFFDIKFDLLRNISANQTEILTDSSIIYLLEQEELTIEDALDLTRKQKNVITTPFFLEKILARQYSVTNFNDLTYTQCEILILPSVQHLLAKNIISLEEATLMSIGAGTILCHQTYYELALKDRRFFNLIQNASDQHAKNLLDPMIMTALANNQLTIADVMNESLEFWGFMFCARLNGVLENKPLQINDDVHKIKKELRQISDARNFPEKILLGLTMKNLLKKIKLALGDDESAFANEIRQEISKTEQEISREVSSQAFIDKWEKTFGKMLGIAKKYLQNDESEERSTKRAKHTSSFFTPKNPSPKQLNLQEFCTRLKGLEPLNRLTEIKISETGRLAIKRGR